MRTSTTWPAFGLDLKKPITNKITCSISERRTEYYRVLRECSPADVNRLIDLSFEGVALQMASSLAAYLPFPDGASYRKGTLLASLTNGLPGVTTVASTTPVEMLPSF